MISKEASAGKFVGGLVKKFSKAKHRAKTPKTNKPGDNLNEAKLNNAEDHARLQAKDEKAKTITGRVGGFVRGKRSDRFEKAIDSNRQQAKDLAGAQKEVDVAKAKKGLAYTAGGVGAAVGVAGAVEARKKNEDTKKLRGAINKTVTRFNQKQRQRAEGQQMQKEAQLNPVDKVAGNALQKFMLKKWKGGDIDGAKKAMGRVSEGTRKAGQVKATPETLERQSHGLAYMGEKGGSRNPNFAKTNTDGKVARKLMNSKAKTGARYIGKDGKVVNLSEEGAKNAEKIKPGILKSKETSLKQHQAKARGVEDGIKKKNLESKLRIPKTSMSPANNPIGMSALAQKN